MTVLAAIREVTDRLAGKPSPTSVFRQTTALRGAEVEYRDITAEGLLRASSFKGLLKRN
jgi:hypothetical protein